MVTTCFSFYLKVSFLFYNAACDLGVFTGVMLRCSCFSYQFSKECWFWSFEGFIALHIKRSLFRRELPWSVLPGDNVERQSSAIHSGHTKNKWSSEMSKSVGGKQSYPVVVKMRLEENFMCFQSGKKKVFNAENCGVPVMILIQGFKSNSEWLLTYWWHLGNTGCIWSFQELGLIVVDILDLDYKFWFRFQGPIGVEVNSLGAQGVVRLLLPIKTS